MRNLFEAALIIVFCSVAACSEQKTDVYKQLVTADSLSRHDQYDSAKTLLASMDTTKLTTEEKALFFILTIRINGTSLYESKLDTMLKFSERYYISTNDSTHLAEVYIHKCDGCYFYKPDHDSSAYFLEKGKKLANQKAPDHFLLSLIYWYQIYIHALTGDYQEMVKDAEMQSLHAEKSGSKRQTAYAALNTVSALNYANQTDKLDLHIQAALNWSKYLRPYDIAFIYSIYGDLFLNNNPTAAKNNFDKAFAIQPNSKIAQKNLARLYFKQGKIKQADSLCQKCLDINWSEEKIDLLTIYADCKIATNHLNEAIEIQKNIISEKDSIINRNKKHYAKNAILKSQPKESTENNNQWLCFALVGVLAISTIVFTILFFIQRKKAKELETKANCGLPHPKEELFIETLEGKDGKNMTQWNKKMQLDFIDYYRNIHPEIIEQIETEFQPLTPTLMIFQILTTIKEPKEIQSIMGITESSYYSNISRIKTKKIVL